METHLFSHTPLIGWLLQREAVQALARDGSPEAVRLMAVVVTRIDNKQVQRGLLKALQKVSHQPCIDSICEVWAATRHPDLAYLLTQHGWIASSPADIRVLSALKVRQVEVLVRGRAEVLEPLLQAFKDSDSIIAKEAKLAIQQLQNPDAQEALCSLVIMQDQSFAREVAIAANYAPRDPSQRALFYFLTAQWDKYESLDYEHTLLQTVYQVGDEQLRQRIAQKIRQAGRAEWVQIIAGGHKGKRLGEMTHDEWETALEILNSRRKLEEMWQLAQAAPPIWSVRLLRQLKDAGWVPKTEFTELVQMGQMCVADVPELNSFWRCQATLHGQGHSNRVKCLGISPDGKLLASGSRDNTVRLWSLPDGQPLQTLTGSDSLGISPDGKLLASGSRDNTVRLWSLPDGQPLQTLTEHSNLVNCLAISLDSKLLASGSEDNTVRLWSLPDGQPLQILTEHSDHVNCLAVSPDGKLLASGSDNTVKLWSLPDGKPLQTLTEHSDWVNCLAISPDGRLLASGSDDNTVSLMWTSGLCYLSRLPIKQMSAEDMQRVQKALQDQAISEAERDWLEFIQALVSWRRRFDVEVEEAPQRIDAGEFDIETRRD